MTPTRRMLRCAGQAALVAACVITLLPFVWIFINSIKYQVDIYTGTLEFTPTLSNYAQLLFSKQGDFMKNVRNSAIVAVASTLVVMAVATLAAYALCRFRWPRLLSTLLLGWILVFHMIPPITLVGPWYLIFQRIGLYNSLLGLSLTHITLNLPMAIWLLMGFLQDVPVEIEEAARIDGCTRVQTFVRVALPLVIPGLIAAGILSFIFSWNEFSVALNLTSLPTQTVPVGISKFVQENEIRHGDMAASAILSTIPALAFMFFGQRFIVKGLTLGALK